MNPFYYPYYSARNVVVRPTPPLQHPNDSHLRDNIEHERRVIEEVVRERQHRLNQQKIRQYQQQLRSKQTTISRTKQDPNPKQVVNNNDHIYKYYKHLQQKLKKQTIQQQILRQRPIINNRQRETKSSLTLRPTSKIDMMNASEYVSKRGLSSCRQDEERQAERVIQQYQRELLNKISGGKRGKQYKSMVDKYNLKDQDNQHIIINKKHIPTPSTNKKIHNNKDKAHNYTSLQPKNIHETINKANTINFSLLEGPFIQQKYNPKQAYKNQKKRGKAKDTICYTGRTTKKNSHQTRSNHRKVTKTKQKLHSAMKRIQNRLKLSIIVFRDSQMMNQRHELWHLEQTYEAEGRLRKQVKDRINNNPKILEKHNLIVSSR